MSLDKSEIQKPRSPKELRKFVLQSLEEIRSDRNEFEMAIQHIGIYRKFANEIIPLSIFSAEYFSDDVKIQPNLGSEGYDAAVLNEAGAPIEYIELTHPHDGAREAIASKFLLKHGHTPIDVGYIGYDLDRVYEILLKTCQDKSLKAYQNTLLVIVLSHWPPTPETSQLYADRIDGLAKKIADIKFTASKVFLLLLHDCRFIQIA